MQSCAEPTSEELNRARGLIATCRWTYATTVPEHPHEYALCAWLCREGQAEFNWFAALIAQHGYSGRFWNRTWVYLDVDGRKYWVSAEVFGDGLIVNRARPTDAFEAAPPAFIDPSQSARRNF